MESTNLLEVSWLFAQKCLIVAVAPDSWIPKTCAALIFPVNIGSSDIYSKFLPFNGFLWIFIPGPKSESILFLHNSIPVIL